MAVLGSGTTLPLGLLVLGPRLVAHCRSAAWHYLWPALGRQQWRGALGSEESSHLSNPSSAEKEVQECPALLRLQLTARNTGTETSSVTDARW